MKSHWKQVGKRLLGLLGWWVLGIITLFVILNLYTLPWTGFGDYKTPTGDFIRGKTLWDWMELLVIPVFLWAGAVAVNRSERELERQRTEDRAKLEREIAVDRQQEAALQAYIGYMTELLLKENLQTTKKKSVRNVARMRTLTVLPGLNPVRKGAILKFLWGAKLINREKPIVDLDEADFSHANLVAATLENVNLYNVNLDYSDLDAAFLEGANLERASFVGANLRLAQLDNTLLYFTNFYRTNLLDANLAGADVFGADFTGANLAHANLGGVDFTESYLGSLFDEDLRETVSTNLTYANLKGAKISVEKLKSVKSLKGAILPDGTIHE